MASERFDSLALSVPNAIADEAILSALISPLDMPRFDDEELVLAKSDEPDALPNSSAIKVDDC